MANWEFNDNPIDKSLQQCLNGPDQSTAGMDRCEGNAYNAWDKELNSVYHQLMQQLTPEGQKSLQDDERNWLKYRDSELNFIDNVYNSKQGTIFAPMEADARANLVKDRVLQLHHRLDILGM